MFSKHSPLTAHTLALGFLCLFWYPPDTRWPTQWGGLGTLLHRFLNFCQGSKGIKIFHPKAECFGGPLSSLHHQLGKGTLWLVAHERTEGHLIPEPAHLYSNSLLLSSVLTAEQRSYHSKWAWPLLPVQTCGVGTNPRFQESSESYNRESESK